MFIRLAIFVCPQKKGIRERYYRQAAATAVAQVRGRSCQMIEYIISWAPARGHECAGWRRGPLVSVVNPLVLGGGDKWQEGELERGASAEEARRARLGLTRSELDKELAAWHRAGS